MHGESRHRPKANNEHACLTTCCMRGGQRRRRPRRPRQSFVRSCLRGLQLCRDFHKFQNLCRGVQTAAGIANSGGVGPRWGVKSTFKQWGPTVSKSRRLAAEWRPTQGRKAQSAAARPVITIVYWSQPGASRDHHRVITADRAARLGSAARARWP
jgi:hypothetical protein